jgi:diketogulonate reductase-like aldo/keto reductase
LEDLKSEGRLKDIGVSNFRPQDLELILDGAKYIPAVNQVSADPYPLVSEQNLTFSEAGVPPIPSRAS